MPIVLTPFVGTGTGADPFKVDAPDNSPFVDLRPDARIRDGFALASASAIRASHIVLGETLDASMNGKTRKDAGAALGVTIAATTVLELLPELMLTHATYDGTRWKPIEEARRADGTRVRRVWLGSLAWEQELAGGPGAAFSESFNQPDSTTLGPDQVWEERSGDWSTSAGELVPSSGDGVAYITGKPETGDQFAKARYTLDASGRLDVVARGHDTDNTFYAAELIRSLLGRNWRLLKYVGGAATVLASVGTGGNPIPCDLRIEAQGSDLTLLVNGVVTLGPVTDTSLAASDTLQRRVGFYTPGASNWRADDFEAGDIVVAQSSSGSGSVSTPTSTAAAGVKTTSGGASTSSASSAAAAGSTSRTASPELTATTSSVVTGSAQRLGSAATSTTTDVTSPGTAQRSGEATVSTATAVSAAGIRAGTATATATSATSTTAAGAKATTAAPGLSSPTSVVSSGTTGREGPGDASTPTSVAAAGTATVAADGSGAPHFETATSAEATGSRASAGAASVAAPTSATAGGRKGVARSVAFDPVATSLDVATVAGRTGGSSVPIATDLAITGHKGSSAALDLVAPSLVSAAATKHAAGDPLGSVSAAATASASAHRSGGAGIALAPTVGARGTSGEVVVLRTTSRTRRPQTRSTVRRPATVSRSREPAGSNRTSTPPTGDTS